MMKYFHSNISLFVTHVGCPHLCSFCNQNSITGMYNLPHAEDVNKAVEAAIKSGKADSKNTEIAFFGGSFTGIDRNYMEELLSAAAKYVKSGVVSGIRISTRPDYINSEILNTLKRYGVTAIEIGAQSMCDSVLLSNRRGHSAADVKNASNLIRQFGFSLGLQMMTGLYKSDAEKDLYTANEIIKLSPDTVRIYPTVIIKGTELYKKYLSGEYKPMSIDDTVSLCAKLLPLFESNNIKVIRLGLHSVQEGTYVKETFHPALGELCRSEIMFNQITDMLKENGDYTVYVADTNISACIGQKKSNIQRLKEKGYNCTVRADKSLTGSKFYIVRNGEKI